MKNIFQSFAKWVLSLVIVSTICYSEARSADFDPDQAFSGGTWGYVLSEQYRESRHYGDLFGGGEPSPCAWSQNGYWDLQGNGTIIHDGSYINADGYLSGIGHFVCSACIGHAEFHYRGADTNSISPYPHPGLFQPHNAEHTEWYWYFGYYYYDRLVELMRHDNWEKQGGCIGGCYYQGRLQLAWDVYYSYLDPSMLWFTIETMEPVTRNYHLGHRDYQVTSQFNLTPTGAPIVTFIITGSYYYHPIDDPCRENSSWTFNHQITFTRLDGCPGLADVGFQTNPKPLVYDQAGPFGIEHVIELRNDVIDPPQGLNIYFDVPDSCITGNPSQTQIKLFPRSGTGPVFDLVGQGGSYSTYFLIDNLTAQGYYDLEIIQSDGSRDTILANVHYIGFQGYQSSGALYNAITGNTIRGAKVSIWQKIEYPSTGFNLYDGMIASDGTYSFNVPAGEYKVLVQYELGGEQWRPEYGTFVVNSPIPYEDIYLTPVTDDTDPPILTLESDTVGEVVHATGTYTDSGVGISVLEIIPGTLENLDLLIEPFDNGAATVSFTAHQADGGAPGIVTLRCVDQLGNFVESPIILESTPPTGDIAGHVTCNSIGLHGVAIDLFDVSGMFIASTATDELGFYQFPDLENGDYAVSISPPLGYQADEETKEVQVHGMLHEVNFELTQQEIPMAQRGRGYWMHQVNALLSGKGNPQETYGDMCNYMELIRTHFNEHELNPINIFTVDLESDCDERLEALRVVISPKPNSSMNDKAKAHLSALLLNMVSGKIAQVAYISEDSATVSQAITYCNTLITDPQPENDEMAKNIAEMINEGNTVPVGWIDLATPHIEYRQSDVTLPTEFSLFQNYPNPFNQATKIEFTLPKWGFVSLNIYDLLGRKVRTLVSERLSSGYKSAFWDGKNDSGNDVASGIYFYQLRIEDFSETKKLVLLK